MPGPQVDELVRQIFRELPAAGSLDAAVESVRQGLERLLPGHSASLSAELAEAREAVQGQFQAIEILHKHSVLQKRPQWYFGPHPTDRHWPAVRDYLLDAKGWDEKDVQAIDDASNEVVSLLGDPQQVTFSCRGLVVGHIQSGKTANMTAVIAKALDAGYNTVILLAGMTNKLRFQTQLRLFEDLVSRYPHHQLYWQLLTPNELNRDFRAPPHGGFLSHVDKAQIAVIKKNVSPLGELETAIRETSPVILNGLKVLVIDDECDQASVNTARGELDMTAINRRIRRLLSHLPRVTYVGYTATPFANVLINPYRADGVRFDDLYPRDFITALPTSARYFGTERLFGVVPDDAGDIRSHEDGLDMIRTVPDDDEALLQPPSRDERDLFHPVMTTSLQVAILYFLACAAARLVRGDGAAHMTMLVHTSAYVVVHERLAALISGWVEVNHANLVDRGSALGKQIERIWAEEHGRLPRDITDTEEVSIDHIFEKLPAVLDAIEFPIENGSSEDRVDYTEGPKTYIVVGGSILARGLTLEGLMVSYFLRSANQYDTLLQMGRWFGYRQRYEDLPRIWMPEDLKLHFRALASVEQEIRNEIDQYRIRDLSPMDIAVRIRAIPGMAITAASKMRSARRCAVSYWGTHRQTFRFDHRNEQVLRRNWTVATELISRAEALDLRDADAELGGRKLWRGVPLSSIQRFLETYTVHPTHEDLREDMLLAFLQNGDPRLNAWNVGVVEAARGNPSGEPLGAAGTVKTVTRARLADSHGVADIKALMSRRDVLFDCSGGVPDHGGWDDLKDSRANDVGDLPLLLLYPIDRTSKPVRESNVRVPLDAEYEVLGYGVVFPGRVTEGGNFVSVELKPFSADELDAIDAEEQEAADAADVE